MQRGTHDVALETGRRRPAAGRARPGDAGAGPGRGGPGLAVAGRTGRRCTRRSGAGGHRADPPGLDRLRLRLRCRRLRPAPGEAGGRGRRRAAAAAALRRRAVAQRPQLRRRIQLHLLRRAGDLPPARAPGCGRAPGARHPGRPELPRGQRPVHPVQRPVRRRPVMHAAAPSNRRRRASTHGLRLALGLGLAGVVLAAMPWLASGAAGTAAPVDAGGVAALRIALGERLFFEPLLSSDRSVSCASCHKPEYAFADNVPLSRGVAGRLGRRNTPAVLNTAARTSMFWDGRAETLEEQAIFPIENPVEMDLPVAQALERLNADPGYREAFKAAYGGPATARSLGRALAAYQKTLESGDSPYDRYARGDDLAISESARRGRMLFIGKGKCADCHSGEDFTSDRFRNIG